MLGKSGILKIDDGTCFLYFVFVVCMCVCAI